MTSQHRARSSSGTSALPRRAVPGLRSAAAISGVALCLLTAACKQPRDGRDEESQPGDREQRSERAKQLAREEAAQRVQSKPTSPVAAPGAAEPPPRASEVPQRLSPSEDLPTPKQLPVAEDFQAETAAAILKGNYHSELDALESEVKSDGK